MSARLPHRIPSHRPQTHSTPAVPASRPAHGYRRRGEIRSQGGSSGFALDVWHEPADERGPVRYIEQSPGSGYVHPVTVDEIRDRLAEIPTEFTERLEVVQLSTLTRRRRSFPCYGMQWGVAVYLYPVEQNLVEQYVRPPNPQQQIEARMFGGVWVPKGKGAELRWTESTIRDFYLNNVLIHEVGHLVDDRNRSPRDRERYANWFAIEYGYKPTGGRNRFRSEAIC